MTANKTLVFSFDGTGNEPRDVGKFVEDESISNVLKLHVLMGGGVGVDKSETKNAHGLPQATYYYNGIGTRESGVSIPLVGRLISSGQQIINMALAPTSGDAQQILQEAKADFDAAKYVEKDTLLVLGFSRGAALARKFASTILKDNPNCRISFLGVFDTVAAMGGIHRKGESISSDVFFENGTLHDRVEKAVHIVSLDEDRVSFAPTLINKDDKNPDRILEAWFPGVHSDIGGGYWFDGLSDNALAFMIGEIRKSIGKSISIQSGSTGSSIQKLLDEQGCGSAGLTVDDIEINSMVGGVVHLHSGLLAKLGDQEPRNVRVNRNDQPGDKEQDLPVVHCSVKERFDQVANYRPATLRGLKFRILENDGKLSGPIHGVSGLRAHKSPK